MRNTTQRSIIFMLNHPLIALKISHLKQKRSFNKPGRCGFLWRDCSQFLHMNIQTTLRSIAAPTKIIIATIFNFQYTLHLLHHFPCQIQASCSGFPKCIYLQLLSFLVLAFNQHFKLNNWLHPSTETHDSLPGCEFKQQKQSRHLT